jgi:hypothetical protein
MGFARMNRAKPRYITLLDAYRNQIWATDSREEAEKKDLEGGDNIGHLIWARIGAEHDIKNWMKDDKTQKGGCSCKSIMIVCVSWGATNAVSISEWFQGKYGFKPRFFVMIEGVSRWGGPYSRNGTAEISNNYYVGVPHWPHGMAVPGANNFDMQNDPIYTGRYELKGNSSWKIHIAGEWAGSTHAITDIHSSKNPGCGH